MTVSATRSRLTKLTTLLGALSLVLISCGDDADSGSGDGDTDDASGDSETGDVPGDGDGDTNPGDGDGDDCPIGIEGCPCTNGGACDPGLICDEGLCLPPNTGDGDGDPTGDGDGDPPDPIDCNALPQGPLDFTVKWGPRATEDFAMTDDGYVIGADNGNLFRSPYDGDPELILPGAGGFITGIRKLSNGDMVFGDRSSGSLNLFANGEATVIASNFSYPNGIEIGLDDMVYVAEQDADRVRRVDPYNGDNEIIAEGTYAANGISFSPTYDRLYVGSFGGGSIRQMTVSDQGDVGPVEIFINDNDGAPVGWGLDGMGVDACGNVYVCQYVQAVLWRISPDGQTFDVIVNLGDDNVQGTQGSGETEWIPNFQWGSGVDGWDEETIYLLDISADKMYEIPVGVPEKPRN